MSFTRINLTWPEECKICHKNFSSTLGLTRHVVNQHSTPNVKKYACEFCDAVFKYKPNLATHQKQNHFMLDPPLQCSKCSKAFWRKTALKTHEITHSVSRPVFPCNYCSKTFISLAGRRQHEDNIHRFGRSNEPLCDICHKSYGSVAALNKHIETMHQLIQNFECVFCEKRFGLQENLKIHLKRHIGEKNFSCGYCRKSFFTNHELKNHILHHMARFPCLHCEIAFGTVIERKGHVKRVHPEKRPPPPRNFICMFCEFGFRNTAALHNHILCHIQELPYFCSHCDKCFRQRGSLVKHETVEHHTDVVMHPLLVPVVEQEHVQWMNY